MPPRSEQLDIVKALQRDLGGCGATIDRTEREIALLREYRTTLTADVVTGKLDVRAAAQRLPAAAAKPLADDDLGEAESADETMTAEEQTGCAGFQGARHE